MLQDCSWCELKHSLCVITSKGLLDLTWNINADVHQRQELESGVCLWKVVQAVLMILKTTRWRRAEVCTLTACVCNCCCLILYWRDKGKPVCSYNIRRGIHELLCSRPAFSLCLVLPWAVHEILLVVWRALAMRKTWHNNRGPVRHLLGFFPTCAHIPGREDCSSAGVFVGPGLVGLTFLGGWNAPLCWRKEPGPNNFIWLLLDLGWGRNVGSVFSVPCMHHCTNDWSTFHKLRNFFHNFTVTYFSSLMDDAFVVSLHQINFGLCWIKILNSDSWTVMYNRLWRVEEQSK